MTEVAVPQRITPEHTDGELPDRIDDGFERYRDFRPLAQGGEASLQTCYDTNLGRTVVMKTLLPQVAHNDIHRKRFLREARVTAQLAHLVTVPVYEISRDDAGEVYFTMKQLRGRDLSQIMDELASGCADAASQYPLDVLLTVLVRVGQCLSYCHSAGVVHRDVKPANIMVDDYGDVALLDWGLAKFIGRTEVDDLERPITHGDSLLHGRLTADGEIQGTPFYMSPEQTREEPNIDGRTDVYNMGIILFELLSGRSFMSGRNFEEIRRKILEDPVRTPADVAPAENIPTELNAICRKALLKDPDDRYSTMDAFVDDLRKYMAGQEVSVYHDASFVKMLKRGDRRLLNFGTSAWMVIGATVCLFLQMIWKLSN